MFWKIFDFIVLDPARIRNWIRIRSIRIHIPAILSHTSYIKDKNEIMHYHYKDIRNLNIYLKQKKLIKHYFLDDLVERGEKLDLLVDKTDNLSATAVTFKTTARTVHHKMWWKNVRYDLIF